MSELFWKCKACKRYIPDGCSHECTPKPTRRELKARIIELEAKLKIDLDSCNKEWRQIFDRAQSRIEELEKELAPYKVKEGRFYYQVGTTSPGYYVCGFCTWPASTSDEMKDHIRETH